MTSRYSIEFVAAAERALANIARRDQKRIALRIDALAQDPRPPGSRKLVGGTNEYRIRSGDYRVVYSVEDRKVLVIVMRIAHRKDIYR